MICSICHAVKNQIDCEQMMFWNGAEDLWMMWCFQWTGLHGEMYNDGIG